MLRCDQCGFDNRDTDKFCAQCGAPLVKPDDAEQPVPDQPAEPPRRPSFMPPPVTTSFGASQQPPDAPPAEPGPTSAPIEKTDFDFTKREDDEAEEDTGDWRMSSLGPPPPRRRRLWLWIVLGILGFCILVCVGAGIWLGFTDSGENFWNNIEATATASAD